MRIRNTVALILTLVFVSSSVWARSRANASGSAIRSLPSNPGHAGRRSYHGSYLNSLNSRRPYLGQRSGFGSGLSSSRYLAQSYGWPGLSFGSPYTRWTYNSYSPHSFYPYLYDLYYQEAQRSKQEADEFEASLERQGKLTGPAKVGAFPSDFLPIPSRGVTATLDGRVQNASPSGDPLVIGSGRHTLRITAR